MSPDTTVRSDSYRIERDSLGEMRVPADALYGAQTQRAVENFPISGLRPYPAFVWSMAVIKRAAAEVNRDLGLLDEKLADAIIEAAEEVIDGKHRDQFVVDPFQAGAGTSHNMNVNEVHRQPGQPDPRRAPWTPPRSRSTRTTTSTWPRAPTTPSRPPSAWACSGGWTNYWRRSTAWRMRWRPRPTSSTTWSSQGARTCKTPCRSGWARSSGAMRRLCATTRERVAAAADRMRRLGIGGTATGTGLNAHPEYHARMVARLSELTGQPLRSSGNLFESMQSQADSADFSGSLRTLCITLVRIANDLRLLSSGPSTGLDEIRLPAVQPGSQHHARQGEPGDGRNARHGLFSRAGLRPDGLAGRAGRPA